MNQWGKILEMSKTMSPFVLGPLMTFGIWYIYLQSEMSEQFSVLSNENRRKVKITDKSTGNTCPPTIDINYLKLDLDVGPVPIANYDALSGKMSTSPMFYVLTGCASAITMVFIRNRGVFEGLAQTTFASLLFCQVTRLVGTKTFTIVGNKSE